MENLINIANKIKNRFNLSQAGELNEIIQNLLELETYSNELKTKTTTIRFQDYISFEKKYEENYYFFKNYHNDESDLLCFNMYYLKKELSDLLELIANEDLGISDIKDLYDKQFFVQINKIIGKIKTTIEKEKQNDTVNYNQIRNGIIFPNNLDDVLFLSEGSKSGSGENSIKKSMVSIGTLMNTSYSSPQFSRFIHKIKNGGGQDFRLTDLNILGERYTTGAPVKVAFFKLPILPENLEMVKERLNAPYLEYIYYISGFGSFADIGMSEVSLYKNLIALATASEEYLQELVRLVSVKFDESSLNRFIALLEESNKQYTKISKSYDEELRHAV